LHGDLVKSEETAIAIAELLLRSNYGVDALQEQKPLTCRDDGEFWTVEGSQNKDRADDGPGWVTMEIRKSNSQVLRFFFIWVIQPRDELPPAN
jgi:hypothetical protein